MRAFTGGRRDLEISYAVALTANSPKRISRLGYRYGLMSDTASESLDELKHDLHGERVGEQHRFICDYCGTDINTVEPVMYEALKVVDMPNLERAIDLPDKWILDAVRCQSCEIEGLEPATDGYDEALIFISINESGGVRSADCSELTVVDVSPNGKGYYPPRIPFSVLANGTDPGYARWTRTKGILEDLASGDYDPDFVRKMQEAVKESRDIPPSVDL